MLDQHRCLSDADLRELLDTTDVQTVAAAVGTCKPCRARRTSLEQRRSLIDRGLHTDTSALSSADCAAAWQRLHPRLHAGAAESRSHREERSRMSQIIERRPVRYLGAIAASLAVVLALVFTPMRTVADDFLNQFRVQKFAAVTIPMDMIEPFSSGMFDDMTSADPSMLTEQMDGLGTFETTFNMDMTSMHDALTPAEAAAQYGDFDSPDSLPDGFDGDAEVWVTEAGSATYTMNTDKAQAIVDEMGIPIYALPDSSAFPEMTFSVNLEAAVVQSWTAADGSMLMAGQTVSPTISYPDGLDMDMLREDILRLPGLPTDLVAQLRAIDDWEETLIIPVPEDAKTENVTINGEAGLLIIAEDGSAIVWQKDGILYAVAGQVSADAVRDVADSMQ